MKHINLNAAENYLILSYNGEDYQIWNHTKGAMVGIRKNIRSYFLQKQKYKCAYCKRERKEAHGLAWDIDHILPKSKYPAFVFDLNNLALSCKECNISKAETDTYIKCKQGSKKLSLESNHYNIVHPHLDCYDDHIEVICISGKLIYRAKNGTKGKKTIEICDLIRFSHQFGEWDSASTAIQKTFFDFLDKLPPDFTKDQIAACVHMLNINMNTN